MLDIKTIGKILQEAGKIEQYQQILELLEKSLEMQNRISTQEEQIKSLTEKFKIKESLKYMNFAYWVPAPGKDDGPFCTRCWDMGRNLVRLYCVPGYSLLRCPECKNEYNLQ